MLLHLLGKEVNSNSKAPCKEAGVKRINTDIYEIEYKEKIVLGVFLFGWIKLTSSLPVLGVGRQTLKFQGRGEKGGLFPFWIVYKLCPYN